MVNRTGTNRADVLEGTGGPDVLSGLAGDDKLKGEGGRDRLLGGSGRDVLRGGTGADRLFGGTEADTASYELSRTGLTLDLGDPSRNTGEARGDTYDSIEDLIASELSDSISGDAGGNALVGLRGNDRLFGLDGDDRLAGGRGADVFDGGDGVDTVFFYYLAGDSDRNEKIVLALDGSFAGTGTSAGDIFIDVENVRGSNKNDKIAGDAKANLLQGFAGKDALAGRDGDDSLEGGTGDDLVKGEGGNDVLEGGRGKDRLSGGNGDDTASGGRGDDRVTGGLGSNTLNGNSGNDVLDASEGINAMFGGDGTDRVTYSSLSIDDQGRGVAVYLTDSLENSGGAAGDILVDIENVSGSRFNDELVGDERRNVLEGRDGDDGLYGQEGSDDLIGNAGADTLSGGDGIDKLFGGDGNDFLEGGAGADSFDGGSGIDTARYFDFPDGVTVSLDGSLAATGSAVGDTFTSVENVTGTQRNDRIAGNSGRNRIEGGDGDDELYGRSGDDVLVGGRSNFALTTETNTLRGEAGNDVLDASFGINKMFGGSGTDTADYSNVGNDSGIIVSLDNGASDFSSDATGDTFSSVERVIGSRFGDTIYGNASNNRLEGGDGNDQLSGLGINSFSSGVFDYTDGTLNQLFGGNGNDVLFAGSEMYGGADSDKFVLTNHASAFQVMDFEVGTDKISIDASRFDPVVDGLDIYNDFDGFLWSENFRSQSTNQATDTKYPVFIFRTTDKTLWYDQDGNGSAFGSIMLVTLNDDITRTDFEITNAQFFVT